MWANSTVKQILNICCNVKYLVVGLWNPLLCQVVVVNDPECRWQRAHSVIIQGIVSVGALGGRVFSNRIECVWFWTETIVLTG